MKRKREDGKAAYCKRVPLAESSRAWWAYFRLSQDPRPKDLAAMIGQHLHQPLSPLAPWFTQNDWQQQQAATQHPGSHRSRERNLVLPHKETLAASIAPEKFLSEHFQEPY